MPPFRETCQPAGALGIPLEQVGPPEQILSGREFANEKYSLSVGMNIYSYVSYHVMQKYIYRINNVLKQVRYPKNMSRNKMTPINSANKVI